ncbi:hypothetical protein EI533_07070 [Pseudomonas donghuensis]|nr:hypothetical protein [Pseudomonas donghuensis]
MNWDDRDKSLAAWRELFTSPKIRMDAVEQYDELVSLAHKIQNQGHHRCRGEECADHGGDSAIC